MTAWDDITLEEHAIAWHREHGREIPPLDSPEWEAMYQEWANWAFSDHLWKSNCGAEA